MIKRSSRRGIGRFNRSPRVNHRPTRLPGARSRSIGSSLRGSKRNSLRPNEPASKQGVTAPRQFRLDRASAHRGRDRRFSGGRRAPTRLLAVVERLLSSPRYGERWGRHWMDVVRYSDTAGDNADYPIPEVALYRDYIIASFNADKPYDQFVCEQLAGDILATTGPAVRYAEQVIATGFIAHFAPLRHNARRALAPDDRGHDRHVWPGIPGAESLRCARCHDHKFDPVTSEDYYGLYGIFASTRYPYAGSEEFQSKGFNRSALSRSCLWPDATPSLVAHAELVDQLRIDVECAESTIRSLPRSPS